MLLVGTAELPDLVAGHIAMGLALVEEECGVAESAVVTEGAAELAQAGVLAVLVAQQRLLVAALVAAVAAGVERRRRTGVVLGSHVLLQLVLPLAGEGAHLAHQGLALVPQLVAAQLISPMAAIGALVALVSSKEGKITIISHYQSLINSYHGPGSTLTCTCVI